MNRRSVLKSKLIAAVVPICLLALGVICLGVGIQTRLSYVDVACDSGQIRHSLFLACPAGSEILQPEVDTEQTGVIGVQNMIEETPVIVKGRFTGIREYCYQSFLSEIEVVEVLRSPYSIEGDILVFEPCRIDAIDYSQNAELEQDNAGVELESTADEDRQSGVISYAVSPTPGPYLYGGTPMKEGEEYLMFLHRKEYPRNMLRFAADNEYILENSPYACLPVEINHGDPKIILSDEKEDPLTFEEASEAVAIVQTAHDEEVYKKTAGDILKNFDLGESD